MNFKMNCFVSIFNVSTRNSKITHGTRISTWTVLF